ncbi:MAG: SRPBCC family protein, partial [Candidatus Thermoplasmatota archaeon]|nr:SRPBCC family protein [Candidatus Thermoplasmatota archaeon]
GIPMTWQSRITSWAPPHHFRDIQERGPYAMWDHLHLFVDKGQETVCVDRVHYALPGGVIGRLAHGLLVARDLRSIFAHRARVLSERFGAPRSWS